MAQFWSYSIGRTAFCCVSNMEQRRSFLATLCVIPLILTPALGQSKAHREQLRAGLISEKQELDARRKKLRLYVASLEFAELSEDQQARVMYQLDLMDRYSHALLERIQTGVPRVKV